MPFPLGAVVVYLLTVNTEMFSAIFYVTTILFMAFSAQTWFINYPVGIGGQMCPGCSRAFRFLPDGECQKCIKAKQPDDDSN